MQNQSLKPVTLDAKHIFKYPGIIEYLFYAYLFYANFAVKLGIYFPLAAPAFLAFIVILVMPQVLFSRSKHFRSTFILSLSVSGLFLMNQFVYFNIPYTHQYVSVLVVWPMLAFVLDFILSKPLSFYRISTVIFIIGLLVLPFMLFQETTAYSRARIEKGVSGFDNPNDLAAWFGFAGLFFWISALRESGWKIAVRQIIAVFLFFIMSTTLSRGTALAACVALIVSLRSVKFNRHLLALVFVATIAIYAGSRIELFEKVKAGYEARLNEESGRLTIWPTVVQTIKTHPLVGLGAGNIKTYSSEKEQDITPHNSFFFLGLSSGMLVLIPFTILWLMALFRSFKRSAPIHRNLLDPFPFVVYSFIVINLGNLQFSAVWATMSLCYALIPIKPEIKKIKRQLPALGLNI